MQKRLRVPFTRPRARFGASLFWILLACWLAGCDHIERIVYLQCDSGAERDAQQLPDMDAGDGDGDGDGKHDAATTADAEVDSGLSVDSPGECPPLRSRNVVDVPGGVLHGAQIDWTCDNIYVLNGVVVVHSGNPDEPQVLRIQAGTQIEGQVTSTARGFLVITRTGRIEARGTREDPIVFTSANPVGSRAREDWGGLTLLGAATTGGTRRVEGYPATVNGKSIEPYLAYGPFPEEPEEEDAGTDASVGANDAGADAPDEESDAGGTAVKSAPASQRLLAVQKQSTARPPADHHDCGTLTFVRVEFASFTAGGGNESNGIQLYACGLNTSFDHVQVHLSGDDGVEVFGGTVDLRHLLVTGASDDGLDWDDGWRGRAQYVIVQQYPDAADLGFEAGSAGEARPTIAPEARIFNATWIGTNDAVVGGAAGSLRGGSKGLLSNMIFLGFDESVKVGGSLAEANLRDGSLALRHSVFWPMPAGDTFGPTNLVADPMLRAPFDLAKPNFAPLFSAELGAAVAESPSEADDDSRPPFFDVDARYLGAIEPQGTDWTSGWTEFPAN